MHDSDGISGAFDRTRACFKQLVYRTVFDAGFDEVMRKRFGFAFGQMAELCLHDFGDLSVAGATLFVEQ